MATITEILEALNIIELLRIFLPAGFAELITLIAFNASFAALAIGMVIFTLSKERLWIDVKARVTNQGKGIIVYPDGSEREVLIKRKQAALVEKLDEKNIMRWIIRPEGWDRQSNGVPVTTFHFDIPHNVGITEFAKFYKGYKQKVIYQGPDGKPVEQFIDYRPLILSAREVDSNIVKLANADVAAMIDPNRALVNAAIAISLIFAVVFGIVFISIFLPSMMPEPDPEVVAKAVKITTTTIMEKSGVSGVAGVTGG